MLLSPGPASASAHYRLPQLALFISKHKQGRLHPEDEKLVKNQAKMLWSLRGPLGRAEILGGVTKTKERLLVAFALPSMF